MSTLLPEKAFSDESRRSPEAESAEVSEVFLDGALQKADVVDEHDESFGIFMHSLILSNTSKVVKEKDSRMDIIGDEQERAVTFFTLRRGFDKSLFDRIAPKVAEINDGQKSGVNSSVHLVNEKLRIISKGNPIELVNRCTHVLMNSRVKKLTHKFFNEITEAFQLMVAEGLEVYAIAIRDVKAYSNILGWKGIPNKMTFVALVGIGRA